MAGDQWRLDAVLREAFENAYAGGAALRLIEFAAAALLVGGIVLDQFQVASLQAVEQEQLAHGRKTAVIAARSGESTELSALDCMRLQSTAGVVSSGPVWDTGRVPVSGGATSARRMVGTRPALWAITGRAGAPVGVVVGSALADELRFVPRTRLEVDGSVVTASAIETLGNREPSLERALLQVGWRSRPADQCWIELAAWAPQELLVAVVSSFDASPGMLSSTLVLPMSALQTDTAASLAVRVSRFAGPAAGLIAAVLWVVNARSRRSEWALYRSLRARRGTVAAVIVLESGVHFAAAAGVAALSLGTRWLLEPRSAVSLHLIGSHTAAFMAVSVACATGSALLLTTGSVMDHLKER